MAKPFSLLVRILVACFFTFQGQETIEPLSVSWSHQQKNKFSLSLEALPVRRLLVQPLVYHGLRV